MIDTFSNPGLSSQDAAFSDGLLNWHRRDVANPYLIDGIPISTLAWYWDLGRREGLEMYAVRLRELWETTGRVTESDRVNEGTLRKLDTQAARQGTGWFRSRAVGGGA